jgi:DNA-binding NarL/FixJ family response regulator
MCQKTLTEREYQIARLIRLGYSNQEIADSIGWKMGSVKSQIYMMGQKLGIREINKKACIATWYVRENRKVEQ